MREEFVDFVAGYPKTPGWRDGTFSDHPIGEIVKTELVDAVISGARIPTASYSVSGSIGKGDWTHTPWLVVLDLAVTTSPEHGYYVVYLLSKGCERLYLALAQGCSTLHSAVGTTMAKSTLRERANVMRTRVATEANRLTPISMDLNVANRTWRGKLYEAGCIVGIEYDTKDLPTEDNMRQDLDEALRLYRFLREVGGWASEDTLIEEARADGISDPSLVQAKRYRQHRTIDRDPRHARSVKQAKGTRCEGCGFEMAEIYGDCAAGVCDAHHLTPLKTLSDGQTISFDPIRDFAVLCPNCHRAIHRLQDPSDLSALKAALENGALSDAQGGFRS